MPRLGQAQVRLPTSPRPAHLAPPPPPPPGGLSPHLSHRWSHRDLYSPFWTHVLHFCVSIQSESLPYPRGLSFCNCDVRWGLPSPRHGT